MRPRDDQRIEIAEQAVTATQELRQPSNSPFDAMKENVGNVQDAWDQVTAIQNQDREDTFYARLGTMTRDEVRSELLLAVQLHLLTLTNARSMANEAAENVQTQLATQEKIQKLLGELPGGDLATTLQNLDRRLNWINDLQVAISGALAIKAQLEARPASAGNDSTPAQPAASKAIPEEAAALLSNVRAFLSEVNTNPQVQASGELLLRAGQQVTDIERQRLSDLRQYLKDVNRQLQALEGRQGDYFRWLALPAFSAVLNTDEFWSALKQVRRDLGASCPSEFDPTPPSLPLISDPVAQQAPARLTPAEEAVCLIQDIESDKKGQDEALARTQALWESRTLRQFVQESLQQTESSDPTFAAPAVVSARLLPQLAVLLFVEEPADQQTELTMARMKHLHSISQSQINADERLALVEQIAQALQIYYQGGMSPAELAQAIMLGSQVLATYFIGSQL